jgi:hypothetical protein
MPNACRFAEPVPNIKNTLDLVSDYEQKYFLSQESGDRSVDFMMLTDWKTRLHSYMTDLAHLAVVDGAVLCDLTFRVIAFAAKIRAEDQVDHVLLAEPFTPVLRKQRLVDFRGTRHQSAARFAHAVPGSLALTVSHDGPATLFLLETSMHDVLAISGLEFSLL